MVDCSSEDAYYDFDYDCVVYLVRITMEGFMGDKITCHFLTANKKILTTGVKRHHEKDMLLFCMILHVSGSVWIIFTSQKFLARQSACD